MWLIEKSNYFFIKKRDEISSLFYTITYNEQYSLFLESLTGFKLL